MNLKSQEHNGITVFELDGRLDAFAVEQVQPALNHAIAAGQVKLVYHLACLNYSGSGGPRRILATVQQPRKKAVTFWRRHRSK